ncbi:hypothetical protein G6F43_001823 [Rhizopus delemar]|nr:hypothetical protein G6F43_001823 [Rhizopus delemar]
MDYNWISDGNNTRKQPSHIPSSLRTMESNTRHRSRADTMPSIGFPIFSNLMQRHRSGSLSLPKEDVVSPTIDENTIASTLASLGLNDDTEQQGFEFHPFSPQARVMMQRPRAISLGMADTFSPFQPVVMQPSPTLRSTRSTNNLLDSSLYLPKQEEEIQEESDIIDHSPSTNQSQIPSRALWLGNINPSLGVPDLSQLFSVYGQVESVRILSDKECAFVNFSTVEAAMAAKDDLETRLGSKLAGTPVRVGFGKADLAVTEVGPNSQGPTRALWVGNLPANVNATMLKNIFQAFGHIESVRILTHKNCGFINFEHQEDAVRARRALQNKEILGLGTGPVRIGFAKVPTINNSTDEEEMADNYQVAQWATAIMMANMMMNNNTNAVMGEQPSLYTAIASERLFIMKQLGIEPSDKLKVERIPLIYRSAIPPVPELGSERKLEPLSLREMRKVLEGEEQISLEQVELIASECMEEIVELCSGNTVVQKLFEYCTEETKYAMLEKIAPHLASIGVHKNGTWAAQKIIDYSNKPEQIELIRQHLAPYVPLLLLDQFGNYVVQCCLAKQQENQYIFDAIADKCWEIGQGRFGARAVRSILENSIISQEQRLYVAAAIVQNAVLLTTNPNGALLLNWFLDASQLPSRYRVLCPRLLPYLTKLVNNKLGSTTIQKIVQQTEEADAATLLLNSLSEKTRAELLATKRN